jgi:hypothetical protein
MAALSRGLSARANGAALRLALTGYFAVTEVLPTELLRSTPKNGEKQ